MNTYGVIEHELTSMRPTDYLYRLSLKCVVFDTQGRVLVVKEQGRTWWDLPGGGMDHGESIRAAIARELKEEVEFRGDFSYRIIAVDEPKILETQNFWQVRLVFAIAPENTNVSPGDDGDEIAFIDPNNFEHAQSVVERQIFRYSQAAKV